MLTVEQALNEIYTELRVRGFDARVKGKSVYFVAEVPNTNTCTVRISVTQRVDRRAMALTYKIYFDRKYYIGGTYKGSVPAAISKIFDIRRLRPSRADER